MKKRLVIILATVSALVLAGCSLIKTKPDVENPNPVEPQSQVVTVKPSENPNDYEGPGDEFPGGLDDDGRGDEEVDASSVVMEQITDPESDMMSAKVTGYDEDGNELWTYETKQDHTPQLDPFKEIGLFGRQYIFVAWGEVISLDIANGLENWVNKDFNGYSVCFTTDYEGDTLYLCGYFGPDLFVMDLEGRTINKVGVADEDYYWPYEITWENEHAVKIKYESNEKELTLDPLGDAVQ